MPADPPTPPAWTSRDEVHMELALEEARAALLRQEVPIGCVLVDEATGAVLARGSNRTNETRNATRHAELIAFDALRESDASAGGTPRTHLRGVTVIVTCEPCLMCAAALASLAPARVVFGCANDRFGGCGSVAAMHEAGVEAAVACGGGKEAPSAPSRRGFPPTPGLRAADAVALLQAFYESGNPAAPVPRRAVVPVVVPE